MANQLPPGQITYQWAALAEKFRLSPLAIAALTDAQIDDVLCHKRDQDGALVPPPKPKPTGLAAKMAKLVGVARLRWMRIISAERADELVKQIEAEAESRG